MVAAIYGQLAGAHYGFSKIPKLWEQQLYSGEQIIRIAEWIDHSRRQDPIKSRSCFLHKLSCTRCQS